MKNDKSTTRKGVYDITYPASGLPGKFEYKKDTYYVSCGRKIGFGHRNKKSKKNPNIYVFGSGRPGKTSSRKKYVFPRRKPRKNFKGPDAYSHSSLSYRKDVAVYQYKYFGKLLLRDYEWD